MKSLAQQSYDNIEHIVVDGGSTDGTVKHIKRHWIDHVDDLLVGPDRGIYHGLNRGIEASSGPIIGMLSCDDWYEPDSLAKVSETFRNSQCSVAWGAMRVWNARGEEVAVYRHHDLPFWYTSPYNHPTLFFTREVYRDLGPYSEEYGPYGDYDMMLKILESAYSVEYIEKIIANFHRVGITGSQPPKYILLWRILKDHEAGLASRVAGLGIRFIRSIADRCLMLLPYGQRIRAWLAGTQSYRS